MKCPPLYAELACTSNFTFLTGASHPQELVARAAELGYSAIAITDECSLAGVVRALEERFNAKTASEFDLISARVKLANERPPLIAAQRRYAMAIEAFRRLVNLDGTPFTLDGELLFAPHDVDIDDIEKPAI